MSSHHGFKSRRRLEIIFGFFNSRCLLSFLEGISDDAQALTARKMARMSLPSEHEMTFPDVNDTPRGLNDFPDDLGEDDSASRQDQPSIWDSINALTPLGSIKTWSSKPNKKVRVTKEARCV